jgi:type I restriction enzyme S subunit
MNADFIAFAVASITSQNWLGERAKGVAYTGINIEDLRRLPLPVPPPGEQVEVVRAVRRLFALADLIERRVQAATTRADKLPQAILSKAFSGELVPTEADLARAEGRTFETAAELFARVKQDDARGQDAVSGVRRPVRAGVRPPKKARRA